MGKSATILWAVKRLNLLLFSFALLAMAPLAPAGKPDVALLEGLDPLANESVTVLNEEAPVLLQFWASWCHSCSGIMFDMDELLNANQGVQYVAVSLDDERQAAYDYITRHALYDKYADRYFHDGNKALSADLGIKTVPTILLLDRNGDVLVKKSGHLNSKDKHELASRMKEAL